MRFFIIFLSFCFGVLLFRWLLNNPKTQNYISKIDRFMSRIAAYLICLPFVIIPYAFLPKSINSFKVSLCKQVKNLSTRFQTYCCISLGKRNRNYRCAVEITFELLNQLYICSYALIVE